MNNSDEPLYRKIIKGGRVTYKVYEPEAEQIDILNFTDEQFVTVAGALGMTLLMVAERHFPPHKLIARKVKAVNEAIISLYNNTGHKLNDGFAEYIVEAWNKTMKEMNA